jgi:hypothetical protein
MPRDRVRAVLKGILKSGECYGEDRDRCLDSFLGSHNEWSALSLEGELVLEIYPAELKLKAERMWSAAGLGLGSRVTMPGAANVRFSVPGLDY